MDHMFKLTIEHSLRAPKHQVNIYAFELLKMIEIDLSENEELANWRWIVLNKFEG